MVRNDVNGQAFFQMFFDITLALKNIVPGSHSPLPSSLPRGNSIIWDMFPDFFSCIAHLWQNANTPDLCSFCEKENSPEHPGSLQKLCLAAIRLRCNFISYSLYLDCSSVRLNHILSLTLSLYATPAEKSIINCYYSQPIYWHDKQSGGFEPLKYLYLVAKSGR